MIASLLILPKFRFLYLASLPIVARSATIGRFYFALSGIGERRERVSNDCAKAFLLSSPPLLLSGQTYKWGKGRKTH